MSVFCDIGTGRHITLVSVKLRMTVFHVLTHPSIKSTVKNLSREYLYGISWRRIYDLAKTCHACKCSKHNFILKIYPISESSQPTGIVGPLPWS